MQAQEQFVTLRDGSGAKAQVAPELGAWLLQYSRQLPRHGSVDVLHFSQEVVDRYPNQMYAGNPLLFPLVSFNWAGGQEHFYDWQGKRYAMAQHGFARKSKWKTAEKTETGVLMELRDSDETRQHYPFQFLCQVRYELRQGKLHFHQTVENHGDQLIPFSTGIHPYFRVPLSSEGSRDDCFIEIPAGRRVTPQGNWETWAAEPASAQELPVAQDVSGTFFMADLAEPEIRLVDPKARLKIRLNFADSPAHRYVALWSKSTREPFYCIEPWTALPNSFARKETELILLEPGQRFTAGMWMDIEEF